MAEVGYWTYDPPNEGVVLFRYGPEVPAARWKGEAWEEDPEVLGTITETTEVTEQTPERAAELFPGALEAEE